MDVREELQALYLRCKTVTNKFCLKTYGHSLSAAKEVVDPSVEELTSLLDFFADILSSMAESGNWHEERLALNVCQGALVMKRLTLAVRSDCEEEYNKAQMEEHTSELQSHSDLVCRLLLEKKKKKKRK